MPPKINIIAKEFDFEALRHDWQLLEKNSNATFFLSWDWLSVWLSTYNLSPVIYRFYNGEQLVGICCATTKQSTKAWLLHWTSLYFHRTGDKKLDQIWLEYNSVLSCKGYDAINFDAFLQYFKNTASYDEWVVGPIQEQALNEQLITDLNTELYWEQPAYAFVLQAEFSDFDVLLSQWSKNTRSQIKRSIKLFEEQQGPLQLQKSATVDESLAWFNECAQLHRTRWEESGFNNTMFVNFHRNLFTTSNNVDLLKISAGDLVIAYLYNFKLANKVYFYLSAIDYELSEQNNKLKPGLVAHALAMQYYAQNGYELYDFMGGEARYKRSLSNITNKLVIVGIQKSTFMLLVHKHLKKMRFFCKSLYSNQKKYFQ